MKLGKKELEALERLAWFVMSQEYVEESVPRQARMLRKELARLGYQLTPVINVLVSARE